MGLAWRWPPGGCHRQRPRSVTKQRNKETRDPVTSPPLPVPDRVARGQLSPKSWPQLFSQGREGPKCLWIKGVCPVPPGTTMTIRHGTPALMTRLDGEEEVTFFTSPLLFDIRS